MPARAGLYRRALPYWAALILLSAAASSVATGSLKDFGGTRLLAGIEPIIVLKAILQQPKQLGQVMLCYGLPTFSQRAGEQDPLFRNESSLIDYFWDMSVGVRYHTFQETLRAGMPILGFRPVEAPRVQLVSERPAPVEQQQPRPNPPEQETNRPAEPAAPSLGEILILHTHTSESYLPISNQDHFNNGRGDIVKVGDYLTQFLEDKGFSVVHDITIHDQVPFRDAYQRSLVTMQRLAADHPDHFALLDIHRDATPGVTSVVELGGKKIARLVIVVGTDRLGLTHPHWRDNLAFANELRDAAERLYPGLVTRIDLADARYNQHVSTRALLIEVGDYHCTLEEVYYAAACLAEILADVARDENADFDNPGRDLTPATAPSGRA